MRDGIAHIAILHEVRPHADNPSKPEDNSPLVFGQIPMGFLQKILGRDANVEDAKIAAENEVIIETGVSGTVKVIKPKYPWHNPNPTFVATWSELFFVEVELHKIGQPGAVGDGLIFKAEYVPAEELLRRIREGVHEGAVYRACTSLSLLMIFFATYPEFFSRE